MRGLLVAIGVDPRKRGTVPADLPPLVLDDARAGPSAHQIARKHGLPRAPASMPTCALTASHRRRARASGGWRTIRWREREAGPTPAGGADRAAAAKAPAPLQCRASDKALIGAGATTSTGRDRGRLSEGALIEYSTHMNDDRPKI